MGTKEIIYLKGKFHKIKINVKKKSIRIEFVLQSKIITLINLSKIRESSQI